MYNPHSRLLYHTLQNRKQSYHVEPLLVCFALYFVILRLLCNDYNEPHSEVSRPEQEMVPAKVWSASHAFSTRFEGPFCHAPSQWEATLHCNVASHWLGAYTKCSPVSALVWYPFILPEFYPNAKAEQLSKCQWIDPEHMMTSSNGKFFPVTGLCVRRIHRSPVNSPHKGQWRGALMVSLICACGWVNNRDFGELRRHRAHYYVTVMVSKKTTENITANNAEQNPGWRWWRTYLKKCGLMTSYVVMELGQHLFM